MSHPLQIKPANKEKRGPIEERKLFVGMLSKKMAEDDVRSLFTRFGTVEECSVIRDENKISRGIVSFLYIKRVYGQGVTLHLFKGPSLYSEAPSFFFIYAVVYSVNTFNPVVGCLYIITVFLLFSHIISAGYRPHSGN